MSTLIFIVVLGGLVIIHEFGHFIVAKLCGVRVEKFSIGFGPVIFGRQFGETHFCVSLLPFGGFVKLSGESAEDSKGNTWEFSAKPLFQRTAVVLAGPFMNAFLAFVLFFVVFFAGQPTLIAKIGKVLPEAPAITAGLLPGDLVLAVSGEPVIYWEDVLKQVRQNKEEILFRIQRQDGVHEIVVKPVLRKTRGLFGEKTVGAFIGVAPSQEVVYVKSSFGKALWLALERVWTMTGMIFASLGLMITGAVPFKDSMTGPIGIFFMTQQAAQMGLLYLLYFTGSLSVSLFVLNLLPIPVLDGGHLLFMLMEHVKGSALKEVVKERMTQGGLVLLLSLMAFVIFQDVHRFSILENIAKIFSR